ncbi:MAG: hypothetical protein HRT88_22390 [Lentisphaeraceae bacterium]|nr:hypothetical protein [Lentisphaeraceae bacterium]
MKVQVLTLLLLFLLASLNAEVLPYEVELSVDGDLSSRHNSVGSYEGTFNDAFNYDASNPTATTPVLALTDKNGYHADHRNFDDEGNSYSFVHYDLKNGAITLTSQDTFYVDVWGRNNYTGRDD